jgi:hypothetical protein
MIEEVRFAVDSLLVGDGFEPSVPQQIRSDLGTAGPSPITVDSLATRNWKFESISLQRGVLYEPDFLESGWRKKVVVQGLGFKLALPVAGSDVEIGFVGSEKQRCIRDVPCRSHPAPQRNLGIALRSDLGAAAVAGPSARVD